METQAKFHHQFHFTKTFKCFIRSSTFVFDAGLVLLEMNCFEKMFKRALQKFAIQSYKILVLSFCPLVTRISGGYRPRNAMFRTACFLVLLLCSVLRSVIYKFRIIEECRGKFQSKLKHNVGASPVQARGKSHESCMLLV